VRPKGSDPDGIVLTFPVPRELAGLRLDRFIQNRIPRLSRTRANEIVRSCCYGADGRRRRPSERTRAGEVVLLVRPKFVEPEVPLHFGVVYDDDDVLGIDKPSGLPMHPTATYHRHTLTYLLRERYGDSPPHIAHRLDRETSGVVVCGKHLDAERGLKRAFEDRKVDKTYLAIVRGRLALDDGRIDLSIAPVREGLHVMMELREDGPPARTEWHVLARKAEHTLLSLHPETGRQHQLRVHLSAVGHPIVGDKLYGPEREAPFLDFIETGMTPALEARLGHHRQALHAHRVRMTHPTTGAPLTIEAPLSPDLARLWEALPDPAANVDRGPHRG
jgi:23S rRNA pseudouridine1911/1915/1917 synthase